MADGGTGIAADLNEFATVLTCRMDGLPISIHLTEDQGQIHIRVFTDIGLSFSESFDPKKTFSKQQVRRWPMQPMGMSRSFGELEKAGG
jgi:hypothetical protein